jgi:hypothetical protein
VAVIFDSLSSSPASDLASEYAHMAADDNREAEALAWAEALLPDAADEPEDVILKGC